MQYLIDSNIIIDYLRGDELVASFITHPLRGEQPSLISVITLYEILCGKDIDSDEKRTKIENLLSLFPVLDVNFSVAQAGANLYRK